ncbi:MAG: hypothetical protein EBW68_03670 [Actinobacteria bacterium]|nr:hypothetical protein [Actinomycetota bacterium]
MPVAQYDSWLINQRRRNTHDQGA